MLGLFDKKLNTKKEEVLGFQQIRNIMNGYKCYINMVEDKLYKHDKIKDSIDCSICYYYDTRFGYILNDGYTVLFNCIIYTNICKIENLIYFSINQSTVNFINLKIDEVTKGFKLTKIIQDNDKVFFKLTKNDLYFIFNISQIDVDGGLDSKYDLIEFINKEVEKYLADKSFNICLTMDKL